MEQPQFNDTNPVTSDRTNSRLMTASFLQAACTGRANSAPLSSASARLSAPVKLELYAEFDG
jgi:hypothetical protein